VAVITVTLELEPARAAALLRFAEKITFETAKSVLYPHVDPDIRGEQTGQILGAFTVLEKALHDERVRSWPWIETGKPL
jgi:hypothetical protein